MGDLTLPRISLRPVISAIRPDTGGRTRLDHVSFVRSSCHACALGNGTQPITINSIETSESAKMIGQYLQLGDAVQQSLTC